jgi:hypothetical protein
MRCSEREHGEQQGLDTLASNTLDLTTPGHHFGGTSEGL